MNTHLKELMFASTSPGVLTLAPLLYRQSPTAAFSVGKWIVTLNQQQQAFVEHDPALSARVLAGPGTGKSYTAVQFLERLAVANPGLRVRMLTFTRAATAEFAIKMNDAVLSGEVI